MKFIFLITSCILLCCCRKNSDSDSCHPSVAAGGITGVTGPATGQINTEYTFAVSYELVNGCISYSGQDAVQSGFTITVTTNLKNDGCQVCSELFGYGTANYIFKTAVPGNYVLRFTNGTNGYIEKDIMIQ